MRRTILVLVATIFMLTLASTVYASEQENITAETFSKLRAATEDEMRALSEYYAVTSYEEHCYKLTDINDETNAIIIIKPKLYKGYVLFIGGDGSLMKLKIGENIEMADIAAQSAHVTVLNGMRIIRNSIDYAYTYDADEGVIKKWNNTILEDSWNVPKNSKYCGFSDDVGSVFRKEDDVYAFTADSFLSTTIEEDKVVKIAEDVESILVLNYWYSEEQYGMPLFLMKDNSIKAYVNEDANLEKADKPDYLLPPIYEGGYCEIIG